LAEQREGQEDTRDSSLHRSLARNTGMSL
jgi:hypothetical protein